MNFSGFKVIVISMLWSLGSQAQKINPLFYHVYAEDGITSDKTTVIYQDFQGYIWIGTEEGLTKFISYDDRNFEQYWSSESDGSTIDNDFITALFEDSSKTLWVGSLTGLCRYDRSTNSFDRLCHRHPLMANKRINAIAEYDSLLWIATNSNLLVYDFRSDSIVSKFENTSIENLHATFNTIHTTNENIWVGTSEGLYAIRDSKFVFISNLGQKNITSLTSSNNQLLVGTSNSGVLTLPKYGLVRQYTTDSEPALVSNRINDILTRANGETWIATDNGLSILTPDQNGTRSLQYNFSNHFGISDEEVRHLYEDDVDAIWLTTPLGGVNYYHDAHNQFDYYGQQTTTAQSDELMDNHVLSLFKEKDNNAFWVGSRGGISRFTEDQKRFDHYSFYLNGQKSNHQIRSITRDSSGIFWLGTERGLFICDLKKKLFKDVSKEFSLDQEDKINIVFTDNQNTVWVGTQSNGLQQVGGQTYHFDFDSSAEESHLHTPGINDILQLSNGTIWIGTSSGLYLLENNKLTHKTITLSNETTLHHPWISFIRSNAAGQLVLGTRQYGLLIISSNDYTGEVLANTSTGLPTNDVRSMTRVSDKLIWVSTAVGLTKLRTVNDHVEKLSNFYLQDGLQGTQFSARAGVLLKNHAYFGGLNGLTHFDPTTVKEYDLPLSVNLTNLHVIDQISSSSPIEKVLTQSIGVKDSLLLEPEQNSFTISFIAVDYMRPKSVQYKFKLENHDKEWQYGHDHSARYTNIPRGRRYTFTVQAISRFRSWSEPKSITIYIAPYFYETAWFKILVAFLAVGLLFVILHYREKSSKFKQRNLQRLVDLKTKELKLEVATKEQTALELEKAKNDAEKANRIKSEFLANISHEIRTPLNGILGMSQLVAENEPNEENREMLNVLGKSAESLKGIIDDLLDLSKIEAGKYDISNDELDLPKLIENVVMAFEPEASIKGINILVNIDPTIPHALYSDELRVKQVLVNLLSNSIKFTEKGQVEIIANLLTTDGTGAKIAVGIKDTGIGIPLDKQEEIFSSFTQVESSSKRKYGGTGLGLAICKKLISLMGGKIWVESVPGHGTHFQFELTFNYTGDHENTGGPVNIDNNKHILLVEDNNVNIMVAKKMLLKSNQRVDTAFNGQEGLNLAKRKKYDLILMDIQMPVMDGLEATMLIRALNHGSFKSPIVALTAGAMNQERAKALEAGMNDFLTKPIKYEQLARVMAKYLNNPEEVPSMQK